jgi:hypothetical protein
MGGEIPLPDDASLYWDRGGVYEGAILHRAEWLVSSERPAAGIGVGWGSKPNIGRPDVNSGPWWGIWRGQTTKDDRLAVTLKGALGTAAAPLDLKPENSAWWPFWKQVPPADEHWYDRLAEWRNSLHGLVLKAWDHLADPLSAVLAASTDQLSLAGAEEEPTDE